MAIFDKSGILGRIYRRALHKYYANDLWIDLKLSAKKEAVEYVQTHMPSAHVARDRYDLLKYALDQANNDGLVLEFGVEKGSSINHLASLTPRTVHGFDSFEGLPSDWKGTMEAKGKFNMNRQLPKVRPNVQLHVGWFDQVLPDFLSRANESIAFMHIDCDIYESAATVFRLTEQRVAAGTIIVFDEYFNYPGWRQNEFKAFQEFIAATDLTYEYIGFSAEKGHVAVRIS